MNSIVATYDSVVDALDIQLMPGTAAARTVTIDDRRNVDLDASGNVVAIEILSPSLGMGIGEIIDRFQLFDFKDELFRLQEMDFRPTQLV
jgi:uncharacterized protein YuzE